MHGNNLGPHSFASPPHERHHAWLTHFSPEQRHQLIQEDLDVRTSIAGVLATCMLFGMTISVICLLAAYYLGML